MGHLKDIRNQPNIQTFPNSNYEVANEVPVTQCETPTIDLAGAALDGPAQTITLNNAFRGFDLRAKQAKVTAPGPAIGNYGIVSNTDHVLHLNFGPLGVFPNINGRVKDVFFEYLTRNVSSFARHIQFKNFSYTIKGAKLYTNITPPRMSDACLTTFHPLT